MLWQSPHTGKRSHSPHRFKILVDTSWRSGSLSPVSRRDAGEGRHLKKRVCVCVTVCYLCQNVYILPSPAPHPTFSTLPGPSVFPVNLHLCLLAFSCFSLSCWTEKANTTCLSTTATVSAARWLSSSQARRSHRTLQTFHLKFSPREST